MSEKNGIASPIIKLMTHPPKTLQIHRITVFELMSSSDRYKRKVEHLHCDPNSPSDESVSSSVSRPFTENLEENSSTCYERVEDTDDCQSSVLLVFPCSGVEKRKPN